MKVARTIAEVREMLGGAADVGLVPTMGALHSGHAALLDAARAECGLVVASMFVNPAQFDDAADLAAYPRDEPADLRFAEQHGVDVVFAPTVEEMYPPGFQTWVDVTEIAQGLEGEARPGHFRGVATVCLKLFSVVRPRRAYFGQKDAQQTAVVRRLVRDLALGVEVRVVSTVRDRDGLALSSRNVRLSPTARERALGLPRALEAGADAYRRGEDPVAAAREAMNGLRPDYVSVLELDERVRVLAAAVRVGGVRLIDNVTLEGELP